jgi:hypothetical protein
MKNWEKAALGFLLDFNPQRLIDKKHPVELSTGRVFHYRKITPTHLR